MNFLHYYTLHEVSDAASLAVFAQQKIGTAPVRTSEKGRYLRSVNDFFALYPAGSYLTLGRTVEWAGAKRRRLAKAWDIPRAVPWAFKDGMLPELDPTQGVEARDSELEARINSALLVETDDYWRNLLAYCWGDRALIYQQWLDYRREVNA